MTSLARRQLYKILDTHTVGLVYVIFYEIRRKGLIKMELLIHDNNDQTKDLSIDKISNNH